MKNLFKFALAAAVVTMFAVACGGNKEAEAPAADTAATTEAPAVIEEPTPAPADSAVTADSAAAPAAPEAAPAH